MIRAILCAGLCVVTTACVSRVMTDYSKAGMSEQQYEADYSDCQASAENVARQTSNPVMPVIPVLAPGYFQALDACMTAKGYTDN